MVLSNRCCYTCTNHFTWYLWIPNTSAFQDTFNQFSVNEKQKTFLQQKEKFYYSDDVARYDEDFKEYLITLVLFPMLNHNQSKYKDIGCGGVRTTISTAELRLAQSRINVEEENRKGVREMKREVVADSLQSIQLKILDLDTNLEGVSELGTLQYLSGLLDMVWIRIINWLILIIIFVFDPLAVLPEVFTNVTR